MEKIKLCTRFFWVASFAMIVTIIVTELEDKNNSDLFVEVVNGKNNEIGSAGSYNKTAKEITDKNRKLLMQFLNQSNNIDYNIAIANALATSIKNELLFMDEKVLIEKSNIPTLSKSVDNVFNADFSLKPEAKKEFLLMLEKDNVALTQEEIDLLKSDVETISKLIATVEGSSNIPVNKESLNLLKKHEKDLSYLVNEQGVAVYNKWKTLRANDEFQTLVLNQDIQNVWNKYFKDEFGESISPVLYLVLGMKQKG